MSNIEKQKVASRVMSVVPSRQALVRAAAPLKYQAFFWPFIRLRHAQGAGDGGFSNLRCRPTVRGHLGLRGASRESAKGAHALTVNARYG